MPIGQRFVLEVKGKGLGAMGKGRELMEFWLKLGWLVGGYGMNWNWKLRIYPQLAHVRKVWRHQIVCHILPLPADEMAKQAACRGNSTFD